MNSNNNTNNNAKIIIGEFNGALKKECESLYEKSQAYLRLDKPTAHLLSHNFACDFGRLNKAADMKVNITSTAKQQKDNMGVLVSKTKTAGILLTHPLNIFRAIKAWEDLMGSGISVPDSKMELVAPLKEYLAELETKAKAQSEIAPAEPVEQSA